MTPKVSKGTVFRIMVNKESLYSVEQRFLWGLVWWPKFKTYNARGAVAYTEISGGVYNRLTDLWRVE